MFQKLFNKNSGNFNCNSVATFRFKNNNTYKESSLFLNGCYSKKSYASYTSLNYRPLFHLLIDRLLLLPKVILARRVRAMFMFVVMIDIIKKLCIIQQILNCNNDVVN